MTGPVEANRRNLSFSSQLMTKVLNMRNEKTIGEIELARVHRAANGRLERDVHYKNSSLMSKVARRSFAEVCILANVVAAAVETAFLTLRTIFLLLTSNREAAKVSLGKLQSSAFTVFWGLFDAALNPFLKHLAPTEREARQLVLRSSIYRGRPVDLNSRGYDFSIPPYRRAGGMRFFDDDRGLREALNLSFNQPGPGLGAPQQERVGQGAHFLIDKVLRGQTEQVIQDFKDADLDIFSYILGRSVYLYVLGSEKNEPVPRFFCENVRNGIDDLRRAHRDRSESASLTQAFSDLAAFNNFSDAGPEVASEEDKLVYNAIKTTSAGELQERTFLRESWQRAIRNLG